MEERIGKAFQTAFGLKPEEFSTSLGPEDVAGWDSLGHLRLVAALQEEFQVEFEVDEVMQMEDVSRIIEVLQGRGIAD